MIFYLIIFIFGLFVGSFLNCVIYRLGKDESFLRGRSYCPHCKHTLSWQDLIPLLNFLILKGKCRYCQKKISLQYPLVEIATGILFVLIFNSQIVENNSLLASGELFSASLIVTCYLFFVSCFLIIVFVYDLKHFIIPDKVIYPLIGITFLFQVSGFQPTADQPKAGMFQVLSLVNPILSAIIAAGFFLMIVLLSRGKWMGLGDVKLALFMGLFLGFPNILVALFLSFFIGAIIGIGLILAKKKTLKSEIPFGPILVTGTLLALFWGKMLVDWYFNLITCSFL